MREHDAGKRVQAAREQLACAQAELDAALQELDDCRASRLRADADLVELHAGLDALSKTNGLSAEAAQRVLERRLADGLRRGATGPE